MKRICCWIVAVITAFGILPATAQEGGNVQFTVNVPNPDAVKCSINGDAYDLVKGANSFDVPEYTNLYFEGVAPWKLTGVTDKTGTSASGFYGDSWYLTAYPDMQDEVFTLILTNLDEFRTSQFTVNVDDPSLVNAVLGGYYTTLDLQAGENVVKFDPAFETFLTISPVAYNIPLYSVKVNGTEVAADNNTYYVDLTENCVVDIVAILPEGENTVNFSYSEGAEGSIKLSVNYEPVADFDGKSIVVNTGDLLTISSNEEYMISEVKINGNHVNFDSSYTFAVVKDTEVFVEAHPFGTIKATIVIPNPELITIYQGYYSENPLPMNQGENLVELPENNSTISWSLSSDAMLNSITLNGESLSSYYTSLALNDGDVLIFDITEKVFDKKAVVWIDNVAAQTCSTYLDLSSTTDHTTRFTFENGYNMLYFYEQMNPFNLSWFGSSDEVENVQLKGKAYLNGVLLEPMYEGSTTFGFDLADNDVLKLFMDTTPVECDVKFEMGADVKAEVVKDLVQAVENPADGFVCFAGTEVSVEGKNITVAVNGTPVTAISSDDASSKFTFNVTDPSTEVTVANVGTGVESIDADSDDTVYNLYGVKVGRSSQLRGMQPGIYIVKGKKVVIAD